MRIDVVTIFPGWFDPLLRDGIPRIAQEKGLLDAHVHDLRGYATDKRRSVDDRPYGGGPGMLMTPGPVFDAVDALEREGVAAGLAAPSRRLLMSPQGRRLDQSFMAELAACPWVSIICGRYEGFDERIHSGLGAEEVSIGDYVLSGGEPAAFVIIDAISRLLPGALGDEMSAATGSFVTGMLSWPQYTRPPEFRGMSVPEVLLSGDHGRIAQWRLEQARRRTAERRPDLLAGPAGERQEETERRMP